MPNEILSVVRYSDPGVASQWLCRAFGFEVHRSADRLEGDLAYVVLRFGDDFVQVGRWDDDDLGVEPGEVGSRSTRAYFIAPEKIDAHCARAVQAGATIEIAPCDKDGGGYYICRDLEGHLWSFGRPPPDVMLEFSQRDGRRRSRKLLIASAVFVLAAAGVAITLYGVEHPIAKSVTDLIASVSQSDAAPADSPTALHRTAEQQADEERQRQAAEAARKAEEESQRQAAEAARKAEEESRRQAAETARKAEEESQRQAAEAARKAEDERQRQAAEEDRQRQAAEAARKTEEERQRQAAEAARKAEEERQRQAAEAARKVEAERQRQAAEAARKAEDERQRQVVEAARKADEERQWQAAEAARKAEEEHQRQAAEAARKVEAERQRQAAEAARKAEEDRQRQAAEAARKAEEERQRQTAEAARKAEEERQRQATEAAAIAKETAEAKARADQETGRRTPAFTVTPEDGARFLKRGRALLTTGDVTGARLFLERASNAGLADAAMELAETYDPAMLRRPNVVGLAGDREQARAWYMRAQALGSSAATERLKSLGGQ